MKKYQTIDIHGKEYMPVNERVKMAHDSGKLVNIETEVLSENPVIIKATVTLRDEERQGEFRGMRRFTGISAANPSKTIEKQSPYEVAETSAVGRALGFAGFGIDSGIASADEMKKAGVGEKKSYMPATKTTPKYIKDAQGDPLKDNEELL